MEITAKMVSQLREQTGAGMMECKKALIESEGDESRARDLLRAKGKAGAEKRAGRAASEGVVAAAATPNGCALIELNSETDFVARNDEFRALAQTLADLAAANGAAKPEEVLALSTGGKTAQSALDDVVTKLREKIVFRRCTCVSAGPETVISTYIHTVTGKIGVLVELRGDPNSESLAAFGRSIAMHIAASKPEFVTRDHVPADVVEHEKKVLAELTLNEGKPEAAIPKIVEGRIGKFFERVCLVEQPFVRDPSRKVGDLLKEAAAEVLGFTMYVVGQE